MKLKIGDQVAFNYSSNSIIRGCIVCCITEEGSRNNMDLQSFLRYRAGSIMIACPKDAVKHALSRKQFLLNCENERKTRNGKLTEKQVLRHINAHLFPEDYEFYYWVYEDELIYECTPNPFSQQMLKEIL